MHTLLLRRKTGYNTPRSITLERKEDGNFLRGKRTTGIIGSLEEN